MKYVKDISAEEELQALLEFFCFCVCGFVVVVVVVVVVVFQLKG